jgi:hypothetical protein
MTWARRYWNVGFVVSAVMAAGCGEELGPEPMRTTRVSGVVRVGDRPVGGGWIEFIPADGTVGNMRTAPLASDGSFVATRVAVGTNIVGLAHAPIALPGGRLFETYNSPIRRDIPAGLSTHLNLDLLAEFFRVQGAGKPRR